MTYVSNFDISKVWFVSVLCRLLLQIHDELLLEVPGDEIKRVAGKTWKSTIFFFRQALVEKFMMSDDVISSNARIILNSSLMDTAYIKSIMESTEELLGSKVKLKVMGWYRQLSWFKKEQTFSCVKFGKGSSICSFSAVLKPLVLEPLPHMLNACCVATIFTILP